LCFCHAHPEKLAELGRQGGRKNRRWKEEAFRHDPQAERLPCKATFSEEIALVQNAYCGFLAVQARYSVPSSRGVEQSNYVMQGGDLDGRLKTLFDALRLPDNVAEAGGVGPGEDENPFFCLLQDDKSISEVSVTTDQLLVLPHEREVKPNDAFLVIHVQINHANAGTFARYF
jgi:hypothetical protein